MLEDIIETRVGEDESAEESSLETFKPPSGTLLESKVPSIT